MAIVLAFLLFFGWQEENPRARAASIYPHPPEPTQLVAQKLDVKIELVKKHWLWTSRTPYQGKVRIEQARPKGGWWIAGNRMTDVNGRLTDEIQLDATWPQHVLFVLVGDRAQIGSFETDLGKQTTFELEIE